MSPSSSPPPKKRDPERTRARLLAAATRVFAARGYEGASLAELVAESGVNRRMIYHYFGDKRGLYRAVFEQQWRTLSARVGAGLGSGDDPLLAALTGFFDFLAEHQPFVRLMMWEGLEGGEISRDIWESSREPVFRSLEAALKAAQTEGRIDPALDVGHLVVNFMGAVTFFFAYAPTLDQVFGEPTLSASRMAKQREQLVELMLNIQRG